jgi:uncharacterized protein YdhG (YjbR/CyaY superfamily)
MNHKPETIDQYIAQFPQSIQSLLQELRSEIASCAPEASEKISWNMPTFYYHGNLVHFAAFKKHIGFFPTASGIQAFEDELGDFNYSKGTIQFPYDKPIPMDLVKRIVVFRVEANVQRLKTKK